MKSATIYKILPATEWEKVKKSAAFLGSDVDIRDGFIHFSDAGQVEATAERYFRGQDGLLLVAADAVALGEALKWEVSRSGEKFPHLYATLPMSAVIWTKTLLREPDGRHRFPDEIP